MSKLDEINERLHQLLPTTVYKITDHKEESFKWAANYQTDVKYLLSIIEQQATENRRLQDELQRFKYRPTKEQAEKLGIIPKL